MKKDYVFLIKNTFICWTRFKIATLLKTYHEEYCLLFQKSGSFCHKVNVQNTPPPTVGFHSLFKDPIPQQTYFLEASICTASHCKSKERLTRPWAHIQCMQRSLTFDGNTKNIWSQSFPFNFHNNMLFTENTLEPF